VINIIITECTLSWVISNGYASYSRQFSAISNYVFVATFFNTAWVIQLANMQKGSTFHFLEKIFNGNYNDYSYDWYGNVGNQLVMAMIVNAICPLIEFTVERTINGLRVCSDNKWNCCNKKKKYITKCTQMGQYLEIHSDVEQELHVKYAEIMTVLFVTLQYGPSMPVFYIIAVFHYFIYYSMARFTLIKKIKLPPSMDETLTTNYLGWMKYAPLLYLFQGYWMLSNKQIFDGWVFPRMEITQPMETGHTLKSTMTLN